MSDRILSAEFPALALFNPTGAWIMSPSGETDWRQVTDHTGKAFDTLWVAETSLDLSGYNLQDRTCFFRNSFEQVASGYSIGWDAGHSPDNGDGCVEQTIISTVPFTDPQLIWAIINSPGFIPLPIGSGNEEYALTFNRTHIIHGHYEFRQIDLTLGIGTSNATLQPSVDEYYSSLEPTAADRLYCYRLISVNDAEDDEIESYFIPAKRVLLGMTDEEEPFLEYMMRLKRSYELANQV